MWCWRERIASKIIRWEPCKRKDELGKKKDIAEATYEKINDQIVAKQK